MDTNELIEQEIQKTLRCLEDEDRVVANPYFYAHLKSKLAQKDSLFSQFSMGKLLNVMMRPSFVLILLLVNMFTSFMIYVHLQTQVDVKQQYLKTFASQYLLTESNNVFEYGKEGK
jgi:hypothetical protein